MYVETMIQLQTALYLSYRLHLPYGTLLGWLLHGRLLASGCSLADGWHLAGEQAGDICGDLLPILVEQPPKAILPRRLLAVVPLLRVPHNLVLLVGLDGKERVDLLSVAVHTAHVRPAS